MTVAAATTDLLFGDVWPPGFRFHPTDEELVLYYLKRKICRRKIKLDIVRETDVYKWDPEELPAQSILKNGDRQWFFFSPRDRKYPNAARSNRATRQGYWKATGKDRAVTCNSRTVGVKKTLVFYRGRAPNGERTDWVMHEYTLDEGELNRCQDAKDYYALYKLYKKSGPGPKNGEQYGAPFKEEEWADEEYASEPVDAIIPVKQPHQAIPDDNEKADDQTQPPLNDFEEFMRQFADETALLQYGPLVTGEQEIKSTVLEPSPRDVLFPESLEVVHDHASLEFSLSPTSHLQLHEAPEVTSFADPFKQLPQICDEDFLEIEDLLNSDILTPDIEKPVENGLQFSELDGSGEIELYHDATMFLQDIGPIEQGTVPFSSAELTMNQVSYQLEPQSTMSLMDWQLQPQLNAFGDNIFNQVDYQLPFQSFGNELEQPFQMDQTNGSIWTPDRSGEPITPSGSNLGNAPPTSGLMHNVNNLDQGDKNSGGSSWFSSAMWSFVDSIPTTPASASETPLINRAFERMPSFGRLRINARNTNALAVNGSRTARRTSRNKGFFFISIFGALCAMLWFLIGMVRVVGSWIAS
ncbi:hypothetical protein V6N13_143266 [Hibiscus sabdariffa]|uniref:NAC domain-containing protein n=1 Tax=Hibiscus sabdariffa TaxID=183260 RepID=A0ABR2FGZ2_9ROSI